MSVCNCALMDTGFHGTVPNGVNRTSNGSTMKMVASSRCIENGLISHAKVNADLLCKQTIAQLQVDLEKVQKELLDKNAECRKLQESSDKVESELEDLTASLFEEANKMVYDANVKREKAEKKLAEAQGNIDALEAEVCALKSLVITSTPSNPNPQSHPQLVKKKEEKLSLISPRRRHKRNRSLTEADKAKKPETCSSSVHEFNASDGLSRAWSIGKMNKEVDQCLYEEIEKWHKTLRDCSDKEVCGRQCPCDEEKNSQMALDRCAGIEQSPFLSRVHNEDMSLCLSFKNEELSQKVSSCIHQNSLSIELVAIPDEMQKCSLSGVITCCKHRVRLDDSDVQLPISQSCRNRLTSVCDFLTYVRYVRQGIVKHSVEQIYWEIIRLRMEMTFARLGYFRDQA